MCGISVCVSSDKQLIEDFIQKSLKLLQHRGPDAHSVWRDDQVCFIHTRLSIQDLSESGSQPMPSSNGRYMVDFNGEVYNHLELRKRFLNDHNFRGHSDTETIAELYQLMGEKCIQYMIGMWAIVIWDKVEKRLFISRDRFGQKPLYWGKIKDSIFISSEIKPLLAVGIDASSNPLAVSEYLALGNYDHLLDQTFFRNIYKFLPAHNTSFSITENTSTFPVQKIYWQIHETLYKDRAPFDVQRVSMFRNLVMEAVESQLLADVSVGATLSGGLDSSVIISCILALGYKGFPVFTAQFPNKTFNESKYVEQLRSKYGNALEVHYANVSSLSLEKDLARCIREQEEPFGDTSIVANGYLVSAAKKEGVKVLLGGQGGDELTMGYSWMYQRLFSYALNHGDAKSFMKFLASGKPSFHETSRMLLSALFPRLEYQLRMKMRLQRKDTLIASFRLPSPGASFGQLNELNGIYLESLKTVGLPHLCHYDDRSGMAESIEGRMPFLDHRLMEFVSTLHPSAFYSNGFSKSLFRIAFQDLLPTEILNRKDKIGFYTPLANLVISDKQWILTNLQDSAWKEWVTLETVNRYVRLLNSNKIDTFQATALFRLISLIQWNKLKSNDWNM